MPATPANTLILPVLCFFLLCSRASLLAWCPIAHYVMARTSLGNTSARFANLPDAWESQNYSFPLSITISPYFCWSHGVISQGTYSEKTMSPRIPLRPEYGDDGREPGEAMLHFVENLLDFSDRAWGSQDVLREACLGFIAHNAADRHVHWSVFQAGVQGSTRERIEAWTIHHGLKETWADFLILESLYPPNQEGRRCISFNDDGSISPPPSLVPTVNPQASGSNGKELSSPLAFAGPGNGRPEILEPLAKLLRLSQMTYNKNRCRTSVVNDDEIGLGVQSESQIVNLLRAQNNLLNNLFTARHWGIWELSGTGYNFVQDIPKVPVIYPDGKIRTTDFDTPASLKVEYQLLTYLAEWYPQWDITEIRTFYTQSDNNIRTTLSGQ